MVTEAVVIAHAIIVATWLYPSVLIVFLQQKRRVMDMTADDPWAQILAHKNLVQTSPRSVVAISAFGSVVPMCPCRYVYESAST